MKFSGRVARAALWVLAVLAVAIAIDNLERPLANPDEGRYSEISREMAQSGDWVTPRLNGIKYFEKPPLQYWASAAAFRLFGENEYSARLYVALCGLATILVVGFTAWKLGGGEQAFASMVALVSSPYFMALGGIVTLDTGLTLWTTLTLCAYLLAEQAARDARKRRRWLMLAWVAMALAVLSKGLVGIVFPAAALGLSCLLRRDFAPLVRLEWGYGLVVFLGIAAPWFVAVSYANPEFAEFFFIHEHFQRFLTASHRRVEPWWYFIPILAAGFLPWMFALPAAVAHAWRVDAMSRGIPPLRLAILWSLFIVVFFSASGSKLPTYILPAFPPLALVLGRYLVDAPPRRLAAWLAPLPLVAAALGVLAWRAPQMAKEPWTRALYGDAMPLALAGAGVLFATGIVAALLLARGRRALGLVTVAIGMVLVVDCIEDAYEKLSPRQSGMLVAERMKPFLKPETRLYSAKIYDQTVPFYIGRTMTLVAYGDEFETGLKSEPGRHVERIEDFPEHWLRPGEAMAIMQPGLFEKLRAQGLPMQVLHEDPRRVLVRKP